jgi:multiple sugar transport system permease protein
MQQASVGQRLNSAFSIVHWRNVPLMIALLIGAFIMVVPFLWMAAASFRPIGESYRLPPSILPDKWDFAAYAEALSSGVPFLRMYWNSFLVASVSTIGALISSAMAAFAFSRLDFRGRNKLFVVMLLGLMVPPALVLIPLFFGYARIGLLDTHIGLALPAMASPFGVFMLRQFMLNQPKALEEAALIDGASYFQIFMRITLPQMGPALATLAIITFIGSWNNFVSPFVLITSWDKMTLPVGIVALQGVLGSARLSVVMAAATMSILPLLLVFLIAQRFIVESITMSGVKG